MNRYLKRISWAFIVWSFLLGMSACEQEEIPVSTHNSGEIMTNYVDMSSDYRYQLFYKLSTHEIIHQNVKTNWDIGFESAKEGWHIVLNTSKAMLAATTQETTLTTIINTDDLTWKFDVSNGNLDSTAIGAWFDSKKVYVLDLGYNLEGVKLGFKKVIFESYDQQQYTFKFANLDGSEETSFTLTKDPSKNFTCFSFDTQSIVDVAPDKDTWDICFTQYQHIFYDESPPIPYLVTGVLLNRNHTEAILDTLIGFENFTYENIEDISFSTHINTIGYDWKTYSFESSSYLIHTDKNYIIKDSDGFFHKLHFIDFYNEKGERGYPVFESQQL